MFGMNGWCKEPNNAGNGSDCPKNAQNSEDRTTGDLISRAAVLEELADLYWTEERFLTFKDVDSVFDRIKALPSAQPEQQWIPCSKRLPEDIKPVIITWQNTDPASYYQYIVGKHYTGTACYKNGKWYWYSSVTEDMLAEYGRYDLEEFDEAIECIAWMPLPEPYMEDDHD